MIQRIQTLWLFVAALVNMGLFYFCLYSMHTTVNGADTITCFRVNDRYVMMLMALVIIVLPLVTIFLFKHRKRQRGIIALTIVANISFITAVLMKIENLRNTPGFTSGSYQVWAFLPVVSIIFLFMALKGIRKDEKLLKSLERLR